MGKDITFRGKSMTVLNNWGDNAMLLRRNRAEIAFAPKGTGKKFACSLSAKRKTDSPSPQKTIPPANRPASTSRVRNDLPFGPGPYLESAPDQLVGERGAVRPEYLRREPDGPRVDPGERNLPGAAARSVERVECITAAGSGLQRHLRLPAGSEERHLPPRRESQISS